MISICVPYWERQDALDRMFEMYDRLYPDLSLEFSICDDGSPSPAKVPEDPRVVLTRLPAKTRPLNPCVPINRAVEASGGVIVVLTNPEVEHREPVLQRMIGALGSFEYVTARCYDVVSNIWLAGEGVDYRTRGRLPVPPGAHFHFLAMFRRELWERAGGFDEDYREVQGCDDNDWLWRLHRLGTSFGLAPVTVYHERSTTKWGLPHGRDLFCQKWPDVCVS